ncbi:hypothetical protein BV898_00105 [Hypsibius exemplaris]|uniref:Mariner Mos1 transposase n=1 Tax=Hypsibius exemplaris TaxID=2072580 RepID=A0A1W0XES9_HYPEX|nr:hypothetical protein BV898_00105 [Hypsibius exemplaris]
MIQQRLARNPRFQNWISGRKWENILKIDEAWVYLTNCKGRRRIYYEFRGERTEESWTKFWKESHPKGVMFVSGVCNRGKIKICFIEPDAKILYSKYCIEKVLTPMLRDDVSRLFPEKLLKKAVFHHDSAPTHASKLTDDWLCSTPIRFTLKED